MGVADSAGREECTAPYLKGEAWNQSTCLLQDSKQPILSPKLGTAAQDPKHFLGGMTAGWVKWMREKREAGTWSLTPAHFPLPPHPHPPTPPSPPSAALPLPPSMGGWGVTPRAALAGANTCTQGTQSRISKGGAKSSQDKVLYFLPKYVTGSGFPDHCSVKSRAPLIHSFVKTQYQEALFQIPRGKSYLASTLFAPSVASVLLPWH